MCYNSELRRNEMTQPKLYEIVETRYQPKKQTKLDFLDTLEAAKKSAVERAKKNIGVRYTVFRQDSVVGEFQAYYRTTITCPKCGEVIPLE
jgi:translation initiation factor 2 beta subunit (eIF-2beta)/eIF-5